VHAPLPYKLPHFFGKNPHDTTSIPAFFACELWIFLRQIRALIVYRGSLLFFPKYRAKITKGRRAESLLRAFYMAVRFGADSMQR
jgi:hypothetical protein